MKNAANPLVSRGPGRPREFDLDIALDRAAKVFSERGYHATSITDLTKAMKVAQGSVYKAFKDKREVFLAAFNRYRILRQASLRKAIDAGETGLDRLRNVLEFYVESSQGLTGRRGCLIVGSATEIATFDTEIARAIGDVLTGNEILLADLIRQGQADGSISCSIDSRGAATMMLCLIQGMRVVGKMGRSREEMQAVVAVALKVLA